MAIHKTAIISPKAKIAKDVEIGPNVIIEDNVVIAKGSKIYANTYIAANTEILDNTVIHMSAVIGHAPQDLSFRPEILSRVRIGKNNVIREFVSIHRGATQKSETVIGNNNFLMASSHIAHNCHVGNNVILANGVLLGGHVIVEDGVFMGGNVGVQQYSSIGKLAMIGGLSRVTKDVPPFMLLKNDSLIYGLNLVGLRRAGFTTDQIGELKKAFKVLYTAGLNTSQALKRLSESDQSSAVNYLIKFIRGSKRGICDTAVNI